MNKFWDELWKITKEEAVWSVKTFFSPVIWPFKFVKRRWDAYVLKVYRKYFGHMVDDE